MTALHALLSTTLVVTPFIMLMLVLVPVLDRKFSPSGRYLLWALVMVGLCLPLVAFIHRPAVQIDIPILSAVQTTETVVGYTLRITEIAPPTIEATQSAPTWEVRLYPAAADGDVFVPSVVNSISRPSFEMILLVIWLAGSALSLAYHAWGHVAFLRYVKRWRVADAENPEIFAIFQQELTRLGICETVRLEYVRGIKSPTLTGLFNSAVLLPSDCDNDNIEDLQFILRHELTHYKRRDLWYKFALVIVRSLHWFNPAVHLMAKQVNKDIELNCDNLTVKDMTIECRIRYSEIILSIASGARNRIVSQFTTSFFGGKNTLKQRFANILGVSKTGFRHGFMFMGAFVLFVGSMVGINFHAQAQTPEERIRNEFLASNIAQNLADLRVDPPGMSVAHLNENAFNNADLGQLRDDELSVRVLSYWELNRRIIPGSREEMIDRLTQFGVQNINGLSAQSLARQLFELSSFRRLNDNELASRAIFGHVDVQTYPVFRTELLIRLMQFEDIAESDNHTLRELATRLFEWDLLATNFFMTAERNRSSWINPGAEYWRAGREAMLHRLSAHEEINATHSRLNIRDLALRIAIYEPHLTENLTGIAIAFSAADLQDRLVLMNVWNNVK